MKDENNLKQNDTLRKAKLVSLTELQPGVKASKNILEGNYSVISDLKLNLDAILGTAELSVKELFDLKVGSIVELDQSIDSLLTLRVDGKPIAFGTLVVVDDNFGIRIDEIVDNNVKPL
jgi:flagellar motor switch protein FliN